MTAAPPARAWRPHPLGVLAAAAPAFGLVFLTEQPAFPLAVAIAGVLATAAHRPRLGLIALVAAIGLGAPLAAGSWLWLPAELGAAGPDALGLDGRARAAVTAAARIIGGATLMIAVGAWIRLDELARSAVVELRIPYRLVGVTLLGERVAVRMRDDFALAALASSARGGRGRRIASVVPVLASSMRRADDLAIALDGRGFGAHPTKTMPPGRRLGRLDGLVVAVAWLLTAAGAVAWW